MDRLKNRRGVTLVLMAFMLTILIGSAAFAVDFGRMFMYRSQLHTASDAAALAGVFQVLQKDPNSASDSAVALANRHSVGTENISLAPADVVPGTWTSAGGFVPSTWIDPNLDAVQVTTRYTGTFGFGKIFGLTSHDVTATSQAVMGYVGATTCVRPVAIPYQKLLDQLFGVGVKPVTYDLTDPDIAQLRAAGPALAVQLKLNSGSTTGNFYIIKLGPYAHSDGVAIPNSVQNSNVNAFADQFGGNCSNSPWAIGPGDWLEGDPGNAQSFGSNGFAELCGISTPNSPGDYPCPAPEAKRSIKVAMWATENDGICTPQCFQVKVVGDFVVTQYTKATGTTPDGIWGFFSAMASTGALTTTPGPIQKIGLVK